MKLALIAGAGGAASKRLIEVLLADPEWSVIGLARTPRKSASRLTWISADLFDAQACRRALAPHGGATHVFSPARAKQGETGVESIPDNVAMLANLVDAIEPVAAGLEHIHVVEGTKWYGMHLGPFPTPAPEDADISHLPDNFYYAQQRMLAERQRGKRWAWSGDKQPVWERIVARHGLAEARLDAVADWAFADFHWAQGYDVVSDPSKLR